MAARTLLMALAAAGATMTGCGGASTRSAAPSAAAVKAQLQGSPPELTALHAQAGRLLTGGPPAFRVRLAELRGHPVVINKWASWCGPCQSEFPAFQRVSAQLGRRVAFLGLDGKDQSAAAASFLRRYPVSYPSYEDPGEQIARALQAGTFYPETIYLDSSGRQVYVHAGPYLSAAALTRDVRFYASR